MELQQERPGLSAYLAADAVVDHEHPLVVETAYRLREVAEAPEAYAKGAYEFVRDTIPHSNDAGDLRVTCRASDVLKARTGICYAKAHALVALLRAQGIPAGFCYQHLGVLHGLAALRLPGRDWIRLDPRGNKPGVTARFRLDREQLAFVPDPAAGEYDDPLVRAAPHPATLEALRTAADRRHLDRILPTAL
ncbi:transglutaminase domain-containing protein [Streptomyces synnematoformans]|uniref:Transglutaminase domain-containing protein n=1 Tax=Streptomyces synnematoformans TaxID=415721 RepID=A0ABN1ZTU7_9ACTN